MRLVKLDDLTFKDFKQWCIDKKLFGYWTYEVQAICDKLFIEMLNVPFWKRKKVWNEVKYKIFSKDIILDILDKEDYKDVI